MEWYLLAFALVALFAFLRWSMPARVELSPDEVRQQRRQFMPYHAGGTLLVLLLVIGLVTAADAIFQRDLLDELQAYGAALLVLMVGIGLYFALLHRLKGGYWLSRYRGFLAHQFGFDYLGVLRVLGVLGIAAGGALLLLGGRGV